MNRNMGYMAQVVLAKLQQDKECSVSELIRECEKAQRGEVKKTVFDARKMVNLVAEIRRCGGDIVMRGKCTAGAQTYVFRSAPAKFLSAM